MALYCRVCSIDSVHPRSIFFMNQCSMVQCTLTVALNLETGVPKGSKIAIMAEMKALAG